MPNNEPSSEQGDNTLSRFKKWLREKCPRVYGFFFSETPFYIRHFFGLLVSLGILGGFLAITVPLWKSWNFLPFLEPLIPTASTDYSKPKAIADLRLHILYITGGIIAILTLLQTNWKNQVDRRKVEDDIQKNKKDHERQVHAERRSRYNQAIEQFGHDNTAVRLGGINTLFGLADEWASDSNIHNSVREKEVQIIIDGLCSYLRSPFNLAYKRQGLEHSRSLTDTDEKLTLINEQKVRRSIFVAISHRLDYINKQDNQSHEQKIADVWKKIKFDFSDSIFFYDLNKLTFKDANFEFSRFYGDTSFNKSNFYGSTVFYGANFYNEASFDEVEFHGDAIFSKARFQADESFDSLLPMTNFRDSNNYFNARLGYKIASSLRLGGKDRTVFWNSKFNGDADFIETLFVGYSHFEKAEFRGAVEFSSLFGKKTNFTDTLINYKKQFKFIFTTRPNKTNNAKIVNITHENTRGNVPEFSRLYDPDTWDETQKGYKDISPPAK